MVINFIFKPYIFIYYLKYIPFINKNLFLYLFFYLIVKIPFIKKKLVKFYIILLVFILFINFFVFIINLFKVYIFVNLDLYLGFYIKDYFILLKNLEILNTNIEYFNLNFNNNLEIIKISNYFSEYLKMNWWKNNKNILSDDYLAGKETFKDLNPNPKLPEPQNDTSLNISVLHETENLSDTENKNFSDLNKKEVEFKKFPKNQKSRDWILGWSMFDSPEVRCFFPIYMDQDLRQGFFTDRGDFYIPGNNFGYFKEQVIYRDSLGNIIPESRIHYNIRPEKFTGTIERPPTSPF